MLLFNWLELNQKYKLLFILLMRQMSSFRLPCCDESKVKKIYRYLHISQIICSRLWFVLMEICLLTNLRVYILIGLTRDLKVDGCQSNLYVMLNQLLFFFISFTTSFVGGILWWIDRVIIIYSNLCNMTTFET